MRGDQLVFREISDPTYNWVEPLTPVEVTLLRRSGLWEQTRRIPPEFRAFLADLYHEYPDIAHHEKLNITLVDAAYDFAYAAEHWVVWDAQARAALVTVGLRASLLRGQYTRYIKLIDSVINHSESIIALNPHAKAFSFVLQRHRDVPTNYTVADLEALA